MSFGFVRPLYDDNRDVHVYNYNREYQLVVLPVGGINLS